MAGEQKRWTLTRRQNMKKKIQIYRGKQREILLQQDKTERNQVYLSLIFKR
jgi:hypothetical protein